MKPAKTLFAAALVCAAIVAASTGSARAAAASHHASPTASAPIVMNLTLPALGMLQNQPPPVAPAPEKKDVDVTVKHETTTWTVSPVWLAIGIIGAIVLVLLIGMAVRGSGTHETTHVVHD